MLIRALSSIALKAKFMANFSDYEQTAKEYNIGGGSDFWRPESGDNRVRILTGYEAYGVHYVQEEKRSYTCISKEKNCPHCLKGDKPKVNFMMWILDRSTNEIKLAQVGWLIIQAIGELSKSEDWKFTDIPDYDIVIKRTGEKLSTKYYITPTPDKTPLTPEQTELATEKIKPVSDIIQKFKDKRMEEIGQDINEQPDTSLPIEDDIEEVSNDDIKVENIPF